MSKKYGFDFDGVLHKSVGITNLSGLRSGKSGKLIPNQTIITKIKELISHGHEIEIISSRGDQEGISNFLNEEFTKEEINSITINKKAANNEKTDTVINSGIIEFYDDSVNVLKEIIWALEDKPTIQIKLFLVRPELDDFIPINTVKELDNELIKLNIRSLCDKSTQNEIDDKYKLLKKNINILINDTHNHRYIVQHIESDNVYWMLYKIIKNRPEVKIYVEPNLQYTQGIVKDTLEKMFSDLRKLTTNIQEGKIPPEEINYNNIQVIRSNIDNWNVNIGEITGLNNYTQVPGLITIVTDLLPDNKIKCLFQERIVKVPRRINIYGTVFRPGTSDFKILINDKNSKNKLFIYNENRSAFLDKSSLAFGSGNGFLRRARLDYNGSENQKDIKIANNLPAEARSLGIPTDVNGNSDPEINKSISQIYNEIYNNNNIYEVYYSIPDNTKAENSGKFMDLGLQTFSGDANALQNIKFISVELRKMFQGLQINFEVNLFLLDGKTITKIELDDSRIDNKI